MIKVNRKHDRFSRSVFAKDILHHLRLQILSGELPAKFRLVEGQLAEEYGVSRGPVRSAIHALEQQGLVQTLPNGGSEVVGFTEKHANDLFDMRENLERMAASEIMRNESIDTQPLQGIIANMLRNGISLQELEQLDIEFHYEFMKLADNWALLQLWGTLRPIITDMLTLSNRLNTANELIPDNHALILKAIEDRKLNVLLQLVEEQIKLPRQLIADWYRQRAAEETTAKSSAQ
ncbi:GntR family transcriptional regulator [Paenibacillus sacheonensis]|uniref:GntR family transcriptional regulator n=1 Tax=Paenibacillus sacheonensis TaxID=742054 RepID=A0A7X4YT62_9BACL|nr:GntR family transcriptional regulator [Paenibacillus sacheonensis]MBM7568358.1 DNA-binding GntR family transcriptional regulator [Paenibacillus sacheonensis]NBC72058.1 GntR family transcriptional regulator [Paenibacillus sacheonensis]